jgi:hypothetical protein
MFQEDQMLVRRIVREEIAVAITALRASLKPVKIETTKPVETAKVDTEALKKGKEK